MQRITILGCLLFLIVSFQVSAEESTPPMDELPEGVIAKRGEGILTREIFDARMNKIPQKDRAPVLRNSGRAQRIMADLLLLSQLRADAEAAEFDKGDIRYRMQLAAETELANAWLEHYVDSQPDADYQAMAREYYLVNKDKFVTESTVDVTHLLLKHNERTPEELEAQAKAYLDQILADPSIFDELVVTVSEDSSVEQNQGQFKGVKKGQMVKPFEEAAFSLKNPGDFSGLVNTSFGIHIIRLDKKNPSIQREFREVETALVAQQKKDYREKLRYDYLTKLGSEPWQVSEKELELMVKHYSEQNEALIEPQE